ncbi:amidohydrolase family protein [Clostridium oryzae]|uniref:Amidohydrolase n=1 Tax=Clostridium oryzae TaxID=1450648 RepID=A0A1V4IS51_9CLOT|nr:amidohydrolase family protein [Clostridium oryzae]OPJ62733.1 amidohydrolase [Clostridium oryzae]
MVIDTHIHPALFAPICKDKQRFKQRCDEMNYHLMSPSGIDLLKKQYALADIQRAFLLPEDCSAETGDPAISNDEIAELVSYDKDFFYGFASVDPRNENASEELERAFDTLKLKGLTINTARLQMYPYDKKLYKLYEVCRKYYKPIIFHSGICLEQNALARYSRPVDFEDVIHDYPDINICLTHFGWPWVQETAALLLKYPNAYANTALMNFDGPYQIYHKVFKEDMGEYWVEHNIADKIMFGSDSPRIRPVRSKRGLDSLDFCSETFEKIYYKNTLRFLGMEE